MTTPATPTAATDPYASMATPVTTGDAASSDPYADIATATQPPASHPISDVIGKVSDVAGGVATGFAKGAGQTVSGISHILNKIPGVGETLAPEAGMKAFDPMTETHGTAEAVGSGLEGLAEFAAGDEAVTGLAKMAKIAKLAPEVFDILEKYPKTAKLFMGGTKGAAVGGGQGLVKGAAEGKGAEEAAAGGAGGAIGGGAGEAVGVMANSGLAKAMMNRASGVTKSMIRYGQDPAKALVEEDLPVFSTLTNSGRQAAANAKLNELKPSLDQQLQASPQVMNWRNELGNLFTDTKGKIHDLETLSDEQKAADIVKINAMEANLAKKWPDGNMSVLDMNELKSRIQKYGSDFDSKPDSSDIMRGFYQSAQGTLKDAVNRTVPEAVDLNRRIANLVALRDASHETILSERAGLGPLTGLGMVKKAEAAAGHVAPLVARAGGNVSKVTAPVLGVGGEEAARIYFQSSDGQTHSVPADQIHEAMKIDPKLTIINQ